MMILRPRCILGSPRSTAAALAAAAGFACAAPPNDLCEQAMPIAWSSLPLTTPIASVATANPAAEVANPCAPSGYTVWYTFLAEANARVRFETCAASNPFVTAPDTTLALYEAPDGDCSNLAAVWCSDDDCAFRAGFTHEVVAGHRYYVQAGLFAGPGLPAPASPDDRLSLSMRLEPPATADLWTEGEDAGPLPEWAQTVECAESPTLIRGLLAYEGDVDMYALEVCANGPISITTAGLTSLDTQLFLFAEDGTGIAMNDDEVNSLASQSRVTLTDGLPPGRCYLAISSFDVDPVGPAGGLLWRTAPYRSQRAPDGPEASGVVTNWVGVGGLAGPYEISLSGFAAAGTCTSNCPPCAADFNQDGGVDGADLAAFFAAWEPGEPCADVNHDGGVDGADIETMILTWETGGC